MSAFGKAWGLAFGAAFGLVTVAPPVVPVTPVALEMAGMGFEDHWLEESRIRQQEEEMVLLAVMNFVLEQS